MRYLYHQIKRIVLLGSLFTNAQIVVTFIVAKRCHDVWMCTCTFTFTMHFKTAGSLLIQLYMVVRFYSREDLSKLSL